MSSWGTRFAVIKRGASDWLNESADDTTTATQSREYLDAKFAKHLFSDEDLAAMVEATLQQFIDHLQASQHKLHANINADGSQQPTHKATLLLNTLLCRLISM